MSYMGYPQEITPAVMLRYSPALQARLREHLATNHLSQADFAKQLGRSPALVSKYLSMTPESEPHGDVPALELLIEDVLKAADQRKTVSIELMETEVYKDINSALETVRKTNEFGLIYGKAGIGKTCGVQLYARDNPTALILDLKDWVKHAEALAGALCEQLSMRIPPRRARSEYLVSRLKGSNRLIIVDNAQRLRRSGLNWLFDFYDSTNCPICLVGNPEILDRISMSDQLFSRMGAPEEIRQQSGAYEIAQKMIAQLAPQFAPCAELAAEVLTGQGHLRYLRKVLASANEKATSRVLRESCSAEELPFVAFRLAHKKLQALRDYRRK